MINPKPENGRALEEAYFSDYANCHKFTDLMLSLRASGRYRDAFDFTDIKLHRAERKLVIPEMEKTLNLSFSIREMLFYELVMVGRVSEWKPEPLGEWGNKGYEEPAVFHKRVNGVKSGKPITKSSVKVLPIMPSNASVNPPPIPPTGRKTGLFTVSETWEPNLSDEMLEKFAELHPKAMKAYESFFPQGKTDWLTVWYLLCQSLADRTGWWTVVLNKEQNLSENK